MNTRPHIQASFRRSKNVFERGIHFVYEKCIKPRSIDEDVARHEFILNTILCGILPLLILLDGFIIVANIREGEHYQGISILSFTSIVLVFAYLLLLSRSGYHRLASTAALLFYFLATTYGAIHWGVELPLVAISYIVIIIISSILISTRCAFWISLGTACTIILITYLQLHHVIHPLLEWKYTPIRINDPVELSLVFFLISAVSRLSNKEMERSLLRARNSEQALREERNLLEIKVEERTKSLKEMQQDKVAQLYRFAEFGKLSSGVFHDLMNSLNVVVASITQLEHSPAHLPDVKTYVHKAVATSRRIGDYIAVVRKQIADDTALSIFSLEKEIRDAVDILHFRAREASVTFILTIQEDVIFQGNALKFYQIVLNLLSNAVDACEGQSQAGIVEISLATIDNKQTILLCIEDNGCGVDPALIENIFNPFFTTKPYGKGIGLGLSQTKEFVEKEFHGTIEMSSIPEKGTRFTITIPFIPHESLSEQHTAGL